MTSPRDHWGEDAACRSADPEELFADSTGQNRAKSVCNGCLVSTTASSGGLGRSVLRVQHVS